MNNIILKSIHDDNYNRLEKEIGRNNFSNEEILFFLMETLKFCKEGAFAIIVRGSNFDPSFDSNFLLKEAARNRCLNIVKFLINDPRVDPKVGLKNSNLPAIIEIIQNHLDMYPTPDIRNYNLPLDLLIERLNLEIDDINLGLTRNNDPIYKNRLENMKIKLQNKIAEINSVKI